MQCQQCRIELQEEADTYGDVGQHLCFTCFNDNSPDSYIQQEKKKAYLEKRKLYEEDVEEARRQVDYYEDGLYDAEKDLEDARKALKDFDESFTNNEKEERTSSIAIQLKLIQADY